MARPISAPARSRGRAGAGRLVAMLASAVAVLVLPGLLPAPTAAAHAPRDKNGSWVSLGDLPSRTYVPTQPKRDGSSWNGSSWPAGIEFTPVATGSSGVKSTLRFDTSQLSGVAQVGKPGRGCRHTRETEVTCSTTAGSADSGGGYSVEAFPLRPAPGAEPGDRGRITVRAFAEGSSATTVKKTEVIVGEPELTVRARTRNKSVASGRPMSVRLAVRNEGSVSALGGFAVGVQPLFTREDITPPHRNCASYPSEDAAECRFPRELKPGETVELDAPFTFKAPKDLLYGQLHVDADPLGTGSSRAELDTDDGQDGDAKKGKGPEAGLTDGPREAGGFLKEDSSLRTISFDGHTDLRTRAQTIRGEVGRTVAVPLSASAHGPQVISTDMTQGDVKAWRMRFTAPAGTRIVGVPEEEEDPLCEVKDRGRVAVCPPDAASWGWDFSVHIDDEIPGAHGKVEMMPNRHYPPHDPDHANDTARVSLHVTGVTTAEKTRRAGLAALPYAAAAGAATMLAAVARYAVGRHRQRRAAADD
jgi:hypothetical protein